MKKFFSAFDKIIYWIETLVSTFSLIVITGIVFAQVFLRYCFGKSIHWGEEVIIALIITMAMFGAARGVRLHAHTDVDMFTKSLPKVPAIIIRTFTTLLLLALLAITTYAAFVLAGKTRAVTTVLRFPQKWTYYSMGIGAGLMLYEFIKVAKDRILGDY